MNDAPWARATQREKLLLIESDHATRRMLQLVLQAEGYDVRAYAGESAMAPDEAEPAAPCLIGDGGSVEAAGNALARIRARGWLGPAILLFEPRTAETEAEAKAAGFAAMLEKPLRTHSLLHEIARLSGSSGPL